MTIQKTTHSCNARRAKKGFTLTEIAIVLGIIGLILGAVWTAASGVYASTNASNFSGTMTQYIAAVRSTCNGSCTSVPTVPVSIPTVAGSGVTPTASISTNNPGSVILTYTMPATMTKLSNALAGGLIAAANTTGSLFGPNVDSQVAPSPNKCTAVNTLAVPECTAPTGYTSSYTGPSTCAAGAAPTGTCSLIFNGTVAAATTYQFEFSPTF